MAIKKISRKAMFFSLIAFALLTYLVFSISSVNQYEMRRHSSYISGRIISSDDFFQDVEADLSRGIYISGFRAILSAEEYISSNGVFIPELGSLQELFVNGTIGNYSAHLMENSTFTDWMHRMEEQAEFYNLGLNLSIQNITINQSTPFSVDFFVTLLIDGRDIAGLASWKRQISISNSINISGFEDPLYAIYSFGKVTNVINRTPYADFVSGNDTTNLLSHLGSSYYLESSYAPDFLLRLQGNLSSSPQGIESMVQLSKFTAQGIAPRSRTIIDYIYFGNISTNDQCIDNSKADPDLPSWFRLDSTDSHINTYQSASIMKNCI